MDSKHFDQKTRIEDSGSDLEAFVAILDRIEATKKLCTKAISGECGSADEKKIIRNSESAWMPSFEWEDFRARDLKAAYMAAKDANGSIKIQEQSKEERSGIKQEVQGSINGRSKRARDPVESAPNFPSEHRVGKRHSPEFKAEMSNLRGASFDLNSDEQEESELAFTVGLPGFS